MEKRIAGAVFVLVFFASAGLLFAQAADPAAPGRRNDTRSGYFAAPAGQGPFPAVVMIHEWRGLNEDATLLAGARIQTAETPAAQIPAALKAWKQAVDYLKASLR